MLSRGNFIEMGNFKIQMSNLNFGHWHLKLSTLNPFSEDDGSILHP